LLVCKQGQGKVWTRILLKDSTDKQDFHSLVTADFDGDGDGDLDIVGKSWSFGSLFWLENKRLEPARIRIRAANPFQAKRSRFRLLKRGHPIPEAGQGRDFMGRHLAYPIQRAQSLNKSR
jgi:hypothetical protein